MHGLTSKAKCGFLLLLSLASLFSSFLPGASSGFSAAAEPLGPWNQKVAVPALTGPVLSAGNTYSAAPGDVLTLTHILTNTGAVSDTYTVTATSNLGWTTLATSSSLSLDAGSAITVAMRVEVPPTATADLAELAGLTVTSALSPSLFAGAVDTVTVCIPVQLLNVTVEVSGCVATLSAAVTGTEPISYSWDFGSLGRSSALTATVEASHGVYPYTLTVSNCGGYSDSTTGTFTISCAPILQADPLTLSVVLNPGQSIGRDLTVRNDGNAQLTWTLAVTPAAEWLAFDPGQGNVAPGESAGVAVTFSSSDFTTTTVAAANLLFSSNDPFNPNVAVTATMVVTTGCLPVANPSLAWVPEEPRALEVITLTGQVEGSPTFTFTWDLGDSTLFTETTGEITHTYSSSGTYRVVITATNRCSATSISAGYTLTVLPPCYTVQNADFGWTPVTITAEVPVTFTGSASGTLPVYYSWDLGDGGTANEQVFTWTYTVPGTHTVVMMATNCGPTPVTASHAITVAAAPCHPVAGADFSWQPQEPAVSQTVTFTAGVASGTPPITYAWHMGNGQLKTGPVVTTTYTAITSYTVWMVATNCTVQTDVVSHSVAITACVPVYTDSLDFSWVPLNPHIGQEVHFSATATGTLPILFHWEWGDGNSADGPTAVHSYEAVGEYTVSLRAVNLCGVAQAERTIEVVSSSVYLPAVFNNFSPGWQQIALPAMRVTDILFAEYTTYLGTPNNVYETICCDMDTTESLLSRGGQTLTYFGDQIYVGNTGQGVFRFDGFVWMALNEGLGNLSVWTLESCGNNLYAGTDTGVYVLSPGGTGWIYSSEGLSSTALSIDTLQCVTDTLYVGTWGSGVYRLDGTAWQPLGRQGLVGDLDRRVWSILSTGATDFFIGTEQGLYKSTDAGASWSLVPEIPLNRVYATRQDSSGNIYVGTFGSGVFVQRGSVWSLLGQLNGNAASVRSMEITTSCPYLYIGTLDGVWRYRLP